MENNNFWRSASLNRDFNRRARRQRQLSVHSLHQDDYLPIKYGLKRGAAERDPVFAEGAASAKKVIKKLKKGKRYYFGIRTYKKVNGKVEYSARSKWKRSKKIK